jgi:hypothetical protein
MATAIGELLADQDQRRRMATAAPLRVRRELSMDAAQARLKLLFAELGLPA